MSALPRPSMSATIGGAITNRVEIAPIKREPKPTTKGRYKADRTAHDVVQRCITASEDEWREFDEAAQRLMINRSEFLRRGARLLLESLARQSDRIARGCGAGTASCTSRSARSTTAHR